MTLLDKQEIISRIKSIEPDVDILGKRIGMSAITIKTTLEGSHVFGWQVLVKICSRLNIKLRRIEPEENSGRGVRDDLFH